MSTLMLIPVVVALLAATNSVLHFFGFLRFKTEKPSTPYITPSVARPVVTDLTVRIVSPTDSSSTSEWDPQEWHRIEKDLYLHKSQQTAWLYVALKDEEELKNEDFVVVDIRVGEQPLSADSDQMWVSRPGGIWLKRSKFSGIIDQAVTKVDVLFGADAVDPRPRWTLLQPSLQLGGHPDTPGARLSVLRGRFKPKEGAQADLRVRNDGKFKIVQMSDLHMVTGTGTCRDAIDADGKHLPESEADPLTIQFIGEILDVEKPDLVVLTGDQLHHDILDSQTALLKALAPIVQREIPFATVFGNHDSEGKHALPRREQMLLLENLPLSLCNAGQEQVDGIGNFFVQIMAPVPSNRPILTMYFLDSHEERQSWRYKPDYDPIQKSQIDWFVDTSHALRSERKKNNEEEDFIGSVVFQHIPVPEFKDDKRLVIHSGHRREPTEGPHINSHFYDALVEQGVLVLACGHDHVNDFCALLQQGSRPDSSKNHHGPWLCYGGVSGFGGYCSYGNSRYHRQARVLELDTRDKSLNTWMRKEYKTHRIDELLLVQGGMVINPPTKDKDSSCILS